MTDQNPGPQPCSFPAAALGVLLIHGLGGTPIELRFIAQSLARAGHTVYCCQLAGHCGTPEELRRSTWQEWYASVEAAHDRLREHCDIIVAGGLSMGGILATHLAQQPPRQRARAAALRADAEARRLVDALVLAAAALRAPAADQARVRPGRARALRPEGRARARAGGLQHAERRRRAGRRLQHADALASPTSMRWCRW